MKIFEGKVLIDGNWQDPESGETLPVMDPSDGSEYGRIARGSDADINSAVQAAQYSMDNECIFSRPGFMPLRSTHIRYRLL